MPKAQKDTFRDKGQTILIVDDDPYVRSSLMDILDYQGYNCLDAGDGKSARDIIDKNNIDLILLDLRLPRLDGMEVLKQSLDLKPDVPVIMISGEGTIQQAVEATKLGAFDFIEKPLEAERILITIRNALKKRDLQIQRDYLLEEAKSKYQMVGTDAKIQQIFSLIDQAAAVDTKILITGESGTGKELVARAIHHRSNRAAFPFITVNCSAIPETLIESELFGHTKGAFTGATTAKIGKFAAAHGGTILLDEIGDMSLMAQAKVLRVLEHNVIDPVGDDSSIKLDVRIIASTNKNLKEEVENGNFREDLYYRLNVLPIHIPPLRERKGDIKILSEFFLSMFSEQHEKKKPEMSPSAWRVFLNYSWPGNIRELKNIIERLAILSHSDFIDSQTVTSLMNMSEKEEKIKSGKLSLQSARAEFEKEFIISSLIENDHKINETAKVLGIQRSHLWRKMKQYGIE
ncbi:MAG: sigma-54-dependent Fis family transcriptional regulator [Calditrichaeota bacterium]|nr:sigma-54-dependent Fis family transcriptional regulator [Calditrichota bacterium]